MQCSSTARHISYFSARLVKRFSAQFSAPLDLCFDRVWRRLRPLRTLSLSTDAAKKLSKEKPTAAEKKAGAQAAVAAAARTAAAVSAAVSTLAVGGAKPAAAQKKKASKRAAKDEKAEENDGEEKMPRWSEAELIKLTKLAQWDHNKAAELFPA